MDEFFDFEMNNKSTKYFSFQLFTDNLLDFENVNNIYTNRQQNTIRQY
jgi:hypothetical protein